MGVLNDKLLFERFLGAHVSVPPNLALIAQGRVVSPSGEALSPQGLLARAQRPLVFKPIYGSKGKGVFRLHADGGRFVVNGETTSPAAALALIGTLDAYLVTPWLQPAAYATEVFPEAGNALRVVTLQDPAADDAPFIAAAYHKFGVRSSAPTDNWSRGGIVVPLDVATGTLGAALRYPEQTAGRPVYFDAHPETGKAIRGLKVPYWSAITGQLLALVRRFPFLRCVGWDVMVTDGGFYVLEGNPAPAVLSLQLGRPLLSDPRAARFVAHHQLVRPPRSRAR